MLAVLAVLFVLVVLIVLVALADGALSESTFPSNAFMALACCRLSRRICSISSSHDGISPYF